MATGVQIETPVQSGATDNPNAPQSTDVTHNEASATAAGYPPQHAEGLPPGAVVGPPLTKTQPATTQKISGLPEGAVLGPALPKVQPAVAAPTPTSAKR